MQFMKRFFYFILLVVCTVSCKDTSDIILKGNDMSDEFEIIASVPSSRVVYNNSHDKVCGEWQSGDKIGIYTSQENNFRYYAETSGSQTRFQPSSDELSSLSDGDTVYAYYPYSPDYDGPVIKVSQNMYQSIGCMSLYNVLYAKNIVKDNKAFLNFKHMYSFLRFRLPSDILKTENGIYDHILVSSTENISFSTEGKLNVKEGKIYNSEGMSDRIVYSLDDSLSNDDYMICDVAVLPQSSDAYITVELMGRTVLLESKILCRKAPEGGFVPGAVYYIDLEKEMAESREKEREALIAIYNSAGGKNWSRSDNWCSDRPLNEWFGVKTNNSGLVESLNLQDIEGYIPEEIQNLKLLNRLTLNTYKQLDSERSFKYISSLHSLRSLSVSVPMYMDFSKIDFSKLENLEALSMVRCNLKGKLPESLKCLRNLRELQLSNNRYVLEDNVYYGLNGEIASFFPYWPMIERFEISSCMFTGSLPEVSDEQGKYLKTFFVNDNSFTGNIPSSHVRILDNMIKVQNDTNLEWNRFGYNISDNLLSGKIPEKIINHEIFPIYLYQIMLQNFEPYVFDKTDIPWWTYKLKSAIDGTIFDFAEIFRKNKYTIIWNLSEEERAMDKDGMLWPRKIEEIINRYGDRGLEVYVNQDFQVSDSRIKEIMSFMPDAKLMCVDNDENNPFYKVSSFLFPNNFFSACNDGSAYGQFFIIDSSAHLIYCGYGGGPKMKYIHGYPESNEDISVFVDKLFSE